MSCEFPRPVDIVSARILCSCGKANIISTDDIKKKEFYF